MQGVVRESSAETCARLAEKLVPSVHLPPKKTAETLLLAPKPTKIVGRASAGLSTILGLHSFDCTLSMARIPSIAGNAACSATKHRGIAGTKLAAWR